MASIGGYSFITLEGGLNPGSGEQLEEITRPGVDGVAYRRIGRRGVPFRMQSLADVANAANAHSLILNYKALQGGLVTLVDETGQSWFNVMVLRVQCSQPKYVTGMSGGLTGGQTGYLVSADWLLQMTEFE